MQKQVRISINGKSYKLASEASEEDAYTAASLVDTLLQEYLVSQNGQEEGRYELALRVALQLALDNCKNQRDLREYQTRIEKLSALFDVDRDSV